MITQIDNKFFLLVNQSVAKSTNRQEAIERVIKELSKQVGDENTNRMKGIYHGKYPMKLIDAVVVCRFFKLTSIEELIQIKTTKALTTVDMLAEHRAA